MLLPVPEVRGLVVTINTTSDCNLRCKYCYEVNKKPGVIKKEYYEKFIDLILLDKIPLEVPEALSHDIKYGYRLDLLGGDALMYPEVCDDILTYFTKKLIEYDLPNKYNIKVNICSNGTLFGNPKVREFLLKWKNIIQCEVSIDGCPELHDLNRVDKNGNGSMRLILKNWDWFRENFPDGSRYTKATLSSNSIPYLYDSLKFMHETLGIEYIYQNFIMEGLHVTEDDLKLLDKEMFKCVEYVRQHENDLYWSMIDKKYYNVDSMHLDKELGWCGSGLMPTLGLDGNIYLCPRWMSLCMNQEDNKYSYGNVLKEDFKPELSKYITEKSKRKYTTKGLKCETCEHESTCPYCIAGAVDYLGEWKRTTEICDTLKIQSHWAKQYWGGTNDYYYR